MFSDWQCGIDNPDLDGKSFLTVRLDYRECFFFYSGMGHSFAVEILVGVCRFCIKICSKKSLVVDNLCVEEQHRRLGPLSGELDGGMKRVQLI